MYIICILYVYYMYIICILYHRISRYPLQDLHLAAIQGTSKVSRKPNKANMPSKVPGKNFERPLATIAFSINLGHHWRPFAIKCK